MGLLCVSRGQSPVQLKLGTGRISFEWSKEMSFVPLPPVTPLGRTIDSSFLQFQFLHESVFQGLCRRA